MYNLSHKIYQNIWGQTVCMSRGPMGRDVVNQGHSIPRTLWMEDITIGSSRSEDKTSGDTKSMHPNCVFFSVFNHFYGSFFKIALWITALFFPYFAIDRTPQNFIFLVRSPFFFLNHSFAPKIKVYSRESPLWQYRYRLYSRSAGSYYMSYFSC